MSTHPHRDQSAASPPQTPRHSITTQPPPRAPDSEKVEPTSCHISSQIPLTRSGATSPPFAAYLRIVSLTASITLSISVAASQGIATGGNLFNISLSGDQNPATVAATHATITAASWFAWAAAVSSLSLIITLVLQLLLTDELFVRHVVNAGTGALPRMMVGVGSWVALGLQATAMALIGQALKMINRASGAMIQWSLLAVGLPSVLFYYLVWYKDRVRSSSGAQGVGLP